MMCRWWRYEEGKGMGIGKEGNGLVGVADVGRWGGEGDGEN